MYNTNGVFQTITTEYVGLYIEKMHDSPDSMLFQKP